jgi:hypothetical protein
MSPEASDDLTIIVDEGPPGTFVVLQSPDAAEHDPGYVQMAHFPSRAAAEAWKPT